MSTSKKYAKTIHLLCAGNKLFVKYQAKGGGLTPNHPLRAPLHPGIVNISANHLFCRSLLNTGTCLVFSLRVVLF